MTPSARPLALTIDQSKVLRLVAGTGNKTSLSMACHLTRTATLRHHLGVHICFGDGGDRSFPVAVPRTSLANIPETVRIADVMRIVVD